MKFIYLFVCFLFKSIDYITRIKIKNNILIRGKIKMEKKYWQRIVTIFILTNFPSEYENTLRKTFGDNN